MFALVLEFGARTLTFSHLENQAEIPHMNPRQAVSGPARLTELMWRVPKWQQRRFVKTKPIDCCCPNSRRPHALIQTGVLLLTFAHLPNKQSNVNPQSWSCIWADGCQSYGSRIFRDRKLVKWISQVFLDTATSLVYAQFDLVHSTLKKRVEKSSVSPFIDIFYLFL